MKPTVPISTQWARLNSELESYRRANQGLASAVRDLMALPPGQELEKINKMLIEYGISYPLGFRGVRDLINHKSFVICVHCGRPAEGEE